MILLSQRIVDLGPHLERMCEGFAAKFAGDRQGEELYAELLRVGWTDKTPHEQADFLATAFRALCPPWEGNHVAPTHPSLLPAIAAEARDLAEVFRFDEDTVAAAIYATEHAETLETIGQTLRFPFPHFFFEWSFADIITGVLCHGSEHACLVYLFQAERNDRCPICFGYGLVDFRNWKCAIKPFIPDMVESEDLRHYVLITGALCAYLNIGGTVNSRRRIADRDKQRARARHGQPPLLSCNVVRISLPIPDRHSKGIRVERGPGVRAHKRIGYLMRINTRGEREVYFRWIPWQWKGDERLGIVHHRCREMILSPRTREYVAKYGDRARSAIPPALQPKEPRP